jgi:hypothetical protein
MCLLLSARLFICRNAFVRGSITAHAGGPCSTLGERGVESMQGDSPTCSGPGARVPRSPKNSMLPGRNPLRRRHGSDGALDPTMTIVPLEIVGAVSPMPFRTGRCTPPI